MTPQQLASISGTLLSLIMSYVPGFEGWYGALTSNAKKLVMLGLLAVIAAAAAGIACAGFGSSIGLELTCDESGLLTLVTSFIAALIANQGTYLITSSGRAKG